jgi:predicted small lipoprotein YifL
VLALAGCGQTGPLTLPGADAPATGGATPAEPGEAARDADPAPAEPAQLEPEDDRSGDAGSR